MNFDAIKKEMSQSVEGLPKNEFKIDLKKGKHNPIYRIRKNMIEEIITTIIAMVVFLMFPFFTDLKMTNLNKSIYLLFMSLTVFMISFYMVKQICFLFRNSNLSINTKDAIKEYIYEVKLTLEAYKSYVIASSLLVPIPSLIIFRSLYLDNSNSLLNIDSTSLFNIERWLNMQLSTIEVLYLVIVYLITGAIFYLITQLWTTYLYGKHVKKLEQIIDELREEEI